MSDLRKAAEVALEALETLMLEKESIYDHAIQALRQALAQPEQRGYCTCGDSEALGVVHFRTRPCFHYTELLAQPEQRPVGTYEGVMETMLSLRKGTLEQQQIYTHMKDKLLYTAPPKREWVGLTRRELDIATLGLEDLSDCYKAIEAKLKEKNT